MDSGNISVAMEYLSHGDLSGYATTGLQEIEMKEITDNVLRGLEIMHGEGFAHRDIKPQVRKFLLLGVTNILRIYSWFRRDQNFESGG